MRRRVIVASAAGAAAAAMLPSCGRKTVTQAVTEDSILRDAEQRLMAELMRRAEAPYQEHVYPWARAYDEAKTTPGMLIYSMARLPEREDLFVWVVPVLQVRYGLWRLRSRTKVAPKSLEDAKQYRIGTHLNGSDDRLLRARGFTDASLLPDDQRSRTVAALMAGRIDMLSGSQLTIKQACRESPELCRELVLVMPTGDSAWFWVAGNRLFDAELVERMRRAHASMLTDGTWAAVLAPYEAPMNLRDL